MIKTKKSPVALAVLALLFEEPMYPYKMWQLFKERHKDFVINIRHRNTLYQTIDRLVRDGLIAEKETRQEKNRPEQTIYKLTENGRETTLVWMRQMIEQPADEFPEFPVALAYLPMLDVDEVKLLLAKRVEHFEKQRSELDEKLNPVRDVVPRLFLLEAEYVLDKIDFEIKWVKSLIDEIDCGDVYWDSVWLAEIAEKFKKKH